MMTSLALGAMPSSHPSMRCQLNYEAPSTKPSPPGLADGSDISAANSVCHPLGTNDLDGAQCVCSICLEPLASNDATVRPVSLKACGHKFHLHCIREVFKHHCSYNCPECRAVLLVDYKDPLACLQGNMPSGNMRYFSNGSHSCAGYEECTSIVITYTIPSAQQQSYHPNPGQRHDSAVRTAYLPDNHQGNELLIRLQVAFLCGLTFTVGTSLTTNRENSVTWSIHHKTSPNGGTQRHGYPAENYISNCHSELDAAGVPSAKICARHVEGWSLPSARVCARQIESWKKCKMGVFFYDEPSKSLFSKEGGQSFHISSVLEKIESQDFTWFVESYRMECPSVVTNPHLFTTGMYQAFVEEGIKCANDVDGYHVQVVFHGTPEVNIENILANGLDPTLRRRQAHGQGEYFASNPAMPLSYCRRGMKLLVFAVIAAKTDIKARNIIVVKNKSRQLPIAVLSFAGYGHAASIASHTFQAGVTQLLEEVKKKEKLVKEARSKEKIIRLIISGEYLAASDIYSMGCDANGKPSQLWADEVAVYVRNHIRDDEMVAIYFPNLPPRPVNLGSVTMLSIDKCEKDAKMAKLKYDTSSVSGSQLKPDIQASSGRDQTGFASSSLNWQ